MEVKIDLKAYKQRKSLDGHDYGFDQKDGFSDLINKWNNKLSQN